MLQPLRRALQRLGVQNLVPDNLDNCLSYSVVSYLKKLKNQVKSTLSLAWYSETCLDRPPHRP